VGAVLFGCGIGGLESFLCHRSILSEFRVTCRRINPPGGLIDVNVAGRAGPV
jgi:hypothetical protein